MFDISQLTLAYGAIPGPLIREPANFTLASVGITSISSARIQFSCLFQQFVRNTGKIHNCHDELWTQKPWIALAGASVDSCNFGSGISFKFAQILEGDPS